MVPINYIAILLAAIAAMPLGFIWYGPLFGKPWMKMMGITKQKAGEMKKNNMTKEYMLQFVGALIMAYVLAHSIFFAQSYLRIDNFSAGIQGGLWNWLGFVAPVTIGAVLWEKKSWKLWAINTGYFLALLIVQGLIIAFI